MYYGPHLVNTQQNLIHPADCAPGDYYHPVYEFVRTECPVTDLAVYFHDLGAYYCDSAISGVRF